jgi:hypothetical protein
MAAVGAPNPPDDLPAMAEAAGRPRPEAGVDHAHDFEQVLLVARGAGGVDVLRSAIAVEAVGQDEDHRPAGAGMDQAIHPLLDVLLPRVLIEKRPAIAGIARQEVGRRITLHGVVITGRHVQPDRACVGSPSGLPPEAVLLESSHHRKCWHG